MLHDGTSRRAGRELLLQDILLLGGPAPSPRLPLAAADGAPLAAPRARVSIALAQRVRVEAFAITIVASDGGGGGACSDAGRRRCRGFHFVPRLSAKHLSRQRYNAFAVCSVQFFIYVLRVRDSALAQAAGAGDSRRSSDGRVARLVRTFLWAALRIRDDCEHRFWYDLQPASAARSVPNRAASASGELFYYLRLYFD